MAHRHFFKSLRIASNTNITAADNRVCAWHNITSPEDFVVWGIPKRRDQTGRSLSGRHVHSLL
jgi:hypothetical protein